MSKQFGISSVIPMACVALMVVIIGCTQTMGAQKALSPLGTVSLSDNKLQLGCCVSEVIPERQLLAKGLSYLSRLSEQNLDIVGRGNGSLLEARLQLNTLRNLGSLAILDPSGAILGGDLNASHVIKGNLYTVRGIKL